MGKRDIYIAVGTAALSFFGALFGVGLGSWLEQSNWERRYDLQQRQSIIDKRIELLEKTVLYINKGTTVRSMQASLDADLASAIAAGECHKEKPKNKKIDCLQSAGFDQERMERTAKELQTINAELVALLSIDSVYFGPQTLQAIKELDQADPWHDKSGKAQDLINAMGKELTYFGK